MCYEPWLSAAILPDGALGPCCAFFDPKSLSIRDLSLEEVWTGAYLQRVREGMFNGKPPGYCVRCPSNLFVDKERIRVVVTRGLRRDRESAAKRVISMVAQGINLLVEQGPAGFARHIRQWFRIHYKH